MFGESSAEMTRRLVGAKTETELLTEAVNQQLGNLNQNFTQLNEALLSLKEMLERKLG